METDEQKIYHALTLWANHIETGHITLGAQDAQKQGKTLNALEPSQMKIVLRLRELAQMALRGDISVQSTEIDHKSVEKTNYD